MIEKTNRHRILKILEENPELNSGINLEYSTDNEAIDTFTAKWSNNKPSGVMATLIDPMNS